MPTQSIFCNTVSLITHTCLKFRVGEMESVNRHPDIFANAYSRYLGTFYMEERPDQVRMVFPSSSDLLLPSHIVVLALQATVSASGLLTVHDTAAELCPPHASCQKTSRSADATQIWIVRS